ncbi:MAG: transcription termination factor NusA [Eubacteriales bacterium]|nr:transcription termination factor NusA [Eubacteriales bacterium]
MTNKDFFQALEDLEREKNINSEQFIESLEAALTSAYKKVYGEAKSALVKLNPEKATIKIYSYKTVVENVEDSDKEISLENARQIKKSYAIGDVVTEEVSPKDFGRIAAQTAKQVVMQKLKELEREQALSEIAEKEDELITAIIKRVENCTVYVQLAGSNMEGVMLENDQIPGEKYNVGDRIKVYVKKIKDSFKGPQVQVSRSYNGFVKKLFEIEVPEVASGDVEIKSIARDPGNRCKVAIYSTKPHIDALGACVGNRGVRINTIMGELNGEKIDLVLYSDDPLVYIAKALAPAEVLSVEINESLKASQVIVPDDKLSLAIGKKGQNVRLAAKLTGWKIDVKPKSKADGSLESTPDYEITSIDDDDDTFANLEDIT